MKTSIALALPLLALAACNSSGPTVTATNASQSEVAAKVADAANGGDIVKPGRWEGTMTMGDMKMPNLPPEQQKMLSSKLGQSHTIVSCVTPEQVKAKRAFFTGQDDKECRYDHFTMAGGKIDAAMHCDTGSGTMNATMSGDYAPDHYHMTMTSDTKAAGNAPYGTMSMTMTIDARRTGECRGDENKAR